MVGCNYQIIEGLIGSFSHFAYLLGCSVSLCLFDIGGNRRFLAEKPDVFYVIVGHF